jgi:serine/threonine protein kinase
MEYLAGETLEGLLERGGRLTPVEAAHVIHQALLGLQYLFEAGLVHRNLEPANLMLVPPPGEDQRASVLSTTVKILDISLSRSLVDDAAAGCANPLRLTYDGEFMGNPNYLAPEQARDPHTSDIRADIYSLGCILYHALAGVPPFQDSTPLGRVIRHATETPQPLMALNPDVPGALQLIVNWMMAKDPAQRYATPGRAAEALHLFLLHEAVPASGHLAQETVAEPPDPEPGPGVHSVLKMASDDSQSTDANDAREQLYFDQPPLGRLSFQPDQTSSSWKPGLPAKTPCSVHRDSLLLLIGGLGLFLAQLLGWLLAHLVLGPG